MAALSNTYISNLLNWVLGTGTAPTRPTTVYVALLTAWTSPTTFTEATGGSYARQALTFGTSSGGGSVSNAAAVNFTGMPAATVVGFGIFDASSGGNLIIGGTLTANKTTNAGDTFTFDTGSNKVTLSLS